MLIWEGGGPREDSASEINAERRLGIVLEKSVVLLREVLIDLALALL